MESGFRQGLSDIDDAFHTTCFKKSLGYLFPQLEPDLGLIRFGGQWVGC